MKNIFKSIICMILLAVLLCSCGPSGNPADNTTAPDTTSAPPENLSLAEYVIVRPDDNSDPAYNPAIKLRAEMAKELGTVKLATDWTAPGQEIPQKEILVGQTVRDESVSEGTVLKYYDWRVRFHPESEKITLWGGSESAIDAAVEWFLDNCVRGKGADASFPADLCHEVLYEGYAINNITINGSELGKYSIVTPNLPDADEKYAAYVLRSMFLQYAGKTVPVIPEKNYETGPAFFIGKTKAFVALNITAGTEASVMPDGERIHVFGEGGYEVAAARCLVAEMAGLAKSGNVTYSLTEKKTFNTIVSTEKKISDFGDIPVAVVDQKNGCAAVYDVSPVLRAAAAGNSAEPALKYTFKPTGSLGYNGLTSAFKDRIDDFRIRYDGAGQRFVMGFTSSQGFVGIAEYPSGKCLWQQTLAGYGPHCIEILPNGLAAVALSGNGDETVACIRVYGALYSSDSADPTSNLRINLQGDTVSPLSYGEYKMNGSHSVVWDPVRGILWALGTKKLVALEISISLGKPSLRLISDYTVDGSFGGHDLGAVAGNPDALFVSGSGAFLIDKAKRTINTATMQTAGVSTSSTKCLCTLLDTGKITGENNILVFRTYAQNVFAEHDTDNFDIFWGSTALDAKMSSVKIKLPTRAFYKARVIDYDYCPDLP